MQHQLRYDSRGGDAVSEGTVYNVTEREAQNRRDENDEVTRGTDGLTCVQ